MPDKTRFDQIKESEYGAPVDWRQLPPNNGNRIAVRIAVDPGTNLCAVFAKQLCGHGHGIKAHLAYLVPIDAGVRVHEIAAPATDAQMYISTSPTNTTACDTNTSGIPNSRSNKGQ